MHMWNILFYLCIQTKNHIWGNLKHYSKIFWNTHFGQTMSQQDVTSPAPYHNYGYAILKHTTAATKRSPLISVLVSISVRACIFWLQYPRMQLGCTNSLWSVCTNTRLAMFPHIHIIPWSLHCTSCVVMCWMRDSCQPRPVLWIAHRLSLLSLSNL